MSWGNRDLSDIEKQLKEQLNNSDVDIEQLLSMSGLDKMEGTTDSGKIKVEFYQESEDLPEPKYEHESDSGFDLRSNEEDFTLKPLQRALVPTGLYVSLPKGMELQIRPKSGLASRAGITVLNTPGTVDSGYKGELKVILVNLSNEETTIEFGDKVAQAVINSVSTGEFIELNGITKEEFDKEETDRGDAGFGSTGNK